VLVDVATHTLGVAVLEPDGEIGFSPILRRNTPLPSRYEETFSTQHSSQEKALISVYQGESPVLDENQLLGRFFLEGLHEADQCDGRIIVRFELSLDGTLEVTAVEAATGVSQRLAIDDALSRLKEQDAEGAVRRLAELTGWVVDAEVEHLDSEPVASGGKAKPASSHAVLLHRARQALHSLNEEDAADVERLIGLIAEAEAGGDAAALTELVSELDELLFYAAG
jgi:molecular chaperone DnaK